MTFLSYVQGELKFIINLDFLVPVLIFLEMLVNFYLSVAEQVTFVSENCSINLQRLEVGRTSVCSWMWGWKKERKCFFPRSGSPPLHIQHIVLPKLGVSNPQLLIKDICEPSSVRSALEEIALPPSWLKVRLVKRSRSLREEELRTRGRRKAGLQMGRGRVCPCWSKAAIEGRVRALVSRVSDSKPVGGEDC